MKRQKPLEEDWDYLIILDACRYDFFEKVYDDYLKGDLEKRKSVASSTPEWASKIFTDRHNLTYFSSNPFINSAGIPLNETEWGSSCGYEWNANEHITNIIDAWHEAWDEELGTVTPEKMTGLVRERMNEIESDRAIIHYMQPHVPYISNGKGRKNKRVRKSFKEAKEEGIEKAAENKGLVSKISNRIKPKVEEVAEDSEIAMKTGLMLDLDLSAILDIGRNGARSTLEDYYEQNLRLVMEEVTDLVEDLDGKVVITSDHGEAFGEKGVWGHHVETHIPALLEVPWMEVEGTVD